MKVITSVITAIFVFAGFCLNAEEVIVTPSSGESFILDVDPTESFLDVVEEIQNHLVNSGLNQENDLDEEQLSFSYTLGVPGIFIKEQSLQDLEIMEHLLTRVKKKTSGILYVPLQNIIGLSLLKKSLP